MRHRPSVSFARRLPGRCQKRQFLRMDDCPSAAVSIGNFEVPGLIEIRRPASVSDWKLLFLFLLLASKCLFVLVLVLVLLVLLASTTS